MIIGPGGSGKSTLANKMGEKLGLPIFHLDTYFWKPGWIETSHIEWQEKQKKIMENQKWIIDGNYEETIDLRLKSCDTVIFLNFSRVVSFYRVYKRYFQFRGKTRPDMNEGCEERVSFEFIRWIWYYPRRSAPVIIQKLNAVSNQKDVIILKSPKTVKRFLENL